MVDLRILAEQIRSGGDADIYRGIRSLDRQFPVTEAVSEAFMRVSESIVRLYPQRVADPIQNPYDARIAAMEFCDHPDTTRDDILRCVEETS
jgi:hypothetical protein